jgi:membrane fusion protein, multidrug efflux system
VTRGLRIALVVAGLSVAAGAATIVGVRDRPARGAGPSASASADRSVPVTTATATREDVPIVLEGLGTVTPLATVTVHTQVDGRLDRVFFKEGDAVTKGSPLALVDPRSFTIQLHQAEAAFARDTANLKNAHVNLDRYTALRKEGLVSQQELDDQRATTNQLEATTKADQAQIDSAKLTLEYARIVSPIDGVTGVRLVDPGNIVHPNDASGIVVVTQLDPIAVIFNLPQDDLPRVQRAIAAGKPPTVEAFARDDKQRLGVGELLLIDNQVNAQTATIKLKAILPNAERALWPNQFVKARLHAESRPNALVVPAAAVQQGPKGPFVYVVAADKRVSPKAVEVDAVLGERAVLAKGLEPGEVVVTDGQNQLKPGAKIATHDRADGGAGPAGSAGKRGRPP